MARRKTHLQRRWPATNPDHFDRLSSRTGCGRHTIGLEVTDDPRLVTCRACRASFGPDEAAAASQE